MASGSRKRKWDQRDECHEYYLVDTVPDKYICSICSSVLWDAHLTVCCGQHYCAPCLTRWLARRKTCPHCQQENFQHVLNKAVVREVNELKVYCHNHMVGCGWVGGLGELKSHLDSDKGCDYVKVNCSNKGCGDEMKRKDLQAHLQKECYYRHIVCEFCGHKDTYITMTHHQYSECPEYPQDCPNKCGVTGIKRRTMPDHRKSCPLEPLDCPFKDAGCTEKRARKDMDDHMTENQQNHTLLTFKSLRRLDKRMKQELHATKQELEKTKQELHKTKQDLQNTKQMLARSSKSVYGLM